MKYLRTNTVRKVSGTFSVLALCALLFTVPSRADDDPAVADPNAGAITGPVLTAADVQAVVAKVAASVGLPFTIAVTDRQGDVLAVYQKASAPALAQANFGVIADSKDVAIALARTASFFSNSQAPLSSRTVRYISGIHFPPGIMFTESAALYGIENTNRGCPFFANFIPGQEIPPSMKLDGTPGLGILTGKADLLDSDPFAVNPGGVPLFKNGTLVGGVGVSGVPPDIAEYAAFNGFLVFPLAVPDPGVVFIDGIALPFVDNQSPPSGVSAGTADGSYFLGPIDAPKSAPEGYLVAPHAGPVGGLSADEVRQIVENTIAQGNRTRAVIRLPLGARAKFVIAVADLDGQLLALNRMPDATIFSIDVAVAKSRNVIFFSGPNRSPDDLPGVPMGTAVTNRSIEFGSEPLYPLSIDFTSPGPFFNLYKFDTLNPCTQGSQTPNPYQNGVVFFPGALPLYRNGVLVGGLGVSGDGVEQDDFATAAGGAGFEAPENIRADHQIVRGVRLPYIKFPRNPVD